MNIFKKINDVRVAIYKRAIGKDAKAFNYFYIDLPQIEGIITEECAKVGLLTVVDFPDGHATLTAYDTEAEEGSLFPSVKISVPCDYTLVDIKGSQPIQKLGGMMTYMRRYLYMQMFAISEHDAVEGIGKLSQDSANQSEPTPEPTPEVQEDIDPKRKELIEKFNKDLPNYLASLVAYKKVNSVDDFSTEFLEEVYNKKTQFKKEQTNG